MELAIIYGLDSHQHESTTRKHNQTDHTVIRPQMKIFHFLVINLVQLPKYVCLHRQDVHVEAVEAPWPRHVL